MNDEMSAVASIALQKQEIRELLRRRRAELTTQQQATASAAVCSRLGELEVVRDAQLVAAYRSFAGEIDLYSVLVQLLARGVTVTVPRVKGNDLEFVPWQPASVERQGAFGISEPVEGEVKDLALHDVVLTPLVAFDKNGSRLGQGKGFYDRSFGHLAAERPHIIGIAYDFQEVEQVPCEPTDFALDSLVTNTKVFYFGTQKRLVDNLACRP